MKQIKLVVVIIILILFQGIMRAQVKKAQNKKETAGAKKDFIEMIFVEGGTFQMGSNDEGGDEKPIHTVLVNDFYIGKFEVTQKEWKAIMGGNPSMFKGANLPVQCMSWYDCQQFIKNLNAKTGKKYRLPTEAEWEYAARGGNKSKGYKYSGSNDINAVAWYEGNSNKMTHEVGQKQPNELGIFDMSGNVLEWCSDWYDESYYKNSPNNNPQGPSSGDINILRGGSWDYPKEYCSPSFRINVNPDYKDFYVNGFRLVQGL